MNEADLRKCTEQYLKEVSKAWATLRAGDAEIPLTHVFVMLKSIATPEPHPLEQRPALPPLSKRLEHAGFSLSPREGLSSPRPGLSSLPITLPQALKEASYMVLLGEPGAGKTTTLQFVGLCFAKPDWAKDRLELEEERIPILLDLNRYAEELARTGPRMEEVLAKEVATFIRDEALSRQLVKQWLKEGRVVVLLDGLDEVPDGLRPPVREEISRFACSDPGEKCRIIVSSRLAGYTSLSGNFRAYILKPFEEPEEAKPYLRGWLAALKPEWKEQADEQAERLLAEMESRPALRRVLDNPLLLRLAAEVYAGTGEIVRNRVELYERWVDESWRRAVRRGAPAERKAQALDRLEEIAWRMQNGLELSLAEEDLSLLGEKMGLLVQLRREKAAFSHLTIREYFVARRLKRAWMKNRRGAWRFLRARLHIPEWREPLLLLVAMLRPEEATDLTRRVEKARSLYEKHLGRDLLLALHLWSEVHESLDALGHLLVQKAVRHKSAGVRAGAAEVLGEIKSSEAVSYLIQMLRDEDVGVQEAAVWALGKIKSPEAVPHLIQMLKDKDTEVCRTVARALERIKGPEVIPHFIQMLQDKEAEVRHAAAWALGELRSPHAVPYLIQMLGDKDAEVRFAAVWALGEIGSFEILPYLVQMLRDKDAGVRYAVVRALGRIGSTETVTHLIQMLEDKDAKVRFAAASALGDIGSTEAVTHLIQMLEDKDAGVRFAAAWALWGIRNPEVVSHLVQMLEDKDAGVRRAAAQALWGIRSPEAVPHLIQMLRDKDTEVRSAAALALGGIRSPEAVPHLIQMLEDKDAEVRSAAALALGGIGSTEAVPHLVRILKDKDEEVRWAAMDAISACVTNVLPSLEHEKLGKQRKLLRKTARALIHFSPYAEVDETLSAIANKLETLKLVYVDPFEPLWWQRTLRSRWLKRCAFAIFVSLLSSLAPKAVQQFFKLHFKVRVAILVVVLVAVVLTIYFLFLRQKDKPKRTPR